MRVSIPSIKTSPMEGVKRWCKMDMSGIEPDPSRMLSERDNQLHHMPLLSKGNRVYSCFLERFPGINK